MTSGLLLAAVVGLALGLLGGGGSVLAVPIFVYLLGFGEKQAIAMSLAVVGFTSLVAAVLHWWAGNVNLRVAATFGPVTMIGAYVGARMATLVSGTFQLVTFALVMLVSAFFMLRGSTPAFSDVRDAGGSIPLGPIVAEGVLVGLLTGFVGVGGGFLVVPVLALLADMPMRVAVGTSLAVIALNAGVGFLGYVGEVEVPWLFMGTFAAIATAGALGGSRLVRIVPQHVLRRSFAAFLIVTGTLILYENRASLALGPIDAATSGTHQPLQAP